MNLLTLNHLTTAHYEHTKNAHLRECPWSVKEDCDDVKPISNWRFATQQEAALAATMWIATPIEKREPNHFRYQFKHTLLILGIESEWCH